MLLVIFKIAQILIWLYILNYVIGNDDIKFLRLCSALFCFGGMLTMFAQFNVL